jgi:hypothetical protein
MAGTVALASTTRLAVATLFCIGVSAALAAIHTNVAPLPRAVFMVSTACTCLLAVLVLSSMGAQAALGRQWLYRAIAVGALVLLAISAVRVGRVGFSIHDEIYSWNMWAIQHVLGEPYDTGFTRAPYPQLFAYWLASIYLGQGQFISQSLPRLMSLIPWLVVLTLPLQFVAAGASRVRGAVTLLAFICFALALRSPMRLAFADPLMTAFVFASVVLVLRYHAQPARLAPFAGAVVLAAMAAMTKQAGLLWACLSLPAIAIVGLARHGWRPSALALAIVGLVAAAIWPLWFGSGFTQNTGVLSRSLGDRSYGLVLAQSAWEYLALRPQIGLLILGSAYLTWRAGQLRAFWALAVLPSLLAWFVFGSYEARLGMHVIAMAFAFLLLALAGPDRAVADPAHQQAPAVGAHAPSRRRRWAVQALALMLVAAGVAGYFKTLGPKTADGARQVFMQHFGNEGATVFDRIVAAQSKVFTTSSYAYGTFFARTPLVRPPDSAQPVDATQAISALLQSRADYAISSGEYAYGPYSVALVQAAQRCPQGLPVLLKSSVNNDFVLYRVNREHLRTHCGGGA